MKKIELLAPAGDLEKLKTAIDYGADAVYCGGEMFSLRSNAGNLSIQELKEGIKYAHDRNKRLYLTVNIFAHNEDIKPFENYLEEIKNIDIDAFIVSDPGIILIIKNIIPNAEIHLSTQANMTNYMTAKFWYEQGIKRIVLARELTFEEISNLIKNIPSDLELEAFVHGAMCISYSGRCLLSNFMVERDANKGECAHPCRWKYHVVEEQRPGEYYPIEEDDRGTYIMNSKDLCLLKDIPTFIQSGIASAKIEGRMKSSYYVATVVRAYRKVIDDYYNDPENFVFKEEYLDELKKASHREFTTGFYFDKPTNADQEYLNNGYTREYSFVGVVRGYNDKTKMALIEQRNKMSKGDEIEIFGPYKNHFVQKIEVMKNDNMEDINSAPHAQQMIYMKVDQEVSSGFMLRKKI